MTYTPINWQTGDTITAEKLNKMDNGWGGENTQLFSETVTTAGSSMYKATLAYSVTIDADSITVTFDSTEYTCSRIDASGGYYYGGFSTSGPDFTNYPFAIESINGVNKVYTETASTHTIAVAAPALQTSSNFDAAVMLAGVFEVVSGTTTFQEACDAFKSGKHVYVVDSSSSGKTYHAPVILVNENAFEIKFVTTTSNDTSLVLSGLDASSADGVLS